MIICHRWIDTPTIISSYRHPAPLRGICLPLSSAETPGVSKYVSRTNCHSSPGFAHAWSKRRMAPLAINQTHTFMLTYIARILFFPEKGGGGVNMIIALYTGVDKGGHDTSGPFNFSVVSSLSQTGGAACEYGAPRHFI